MRLSPSVWAIVFGEQIRQPKSYIKYSFEYYVLKISVLRPLKLDGKI